MSLEVKIRNVTEIGNSLKVNAVMLIPSVSFLLYLILLSSEFIL